MQPRFLELRAEYRRCYARLIASYLRFKALWLKANFDPNQPRVPRGHSDGGQWTDDPSFGGGGAYRDRRTHLAQGTVGSPYAIESLLDHEGRHGGHTIAMHVDKSDAFLIRRLMTPMPSAFGRRRYLTEASTFRNIKEATGFINSTLSDPRNRAEIDAVIAGRLSRVGLEAEFSRVVGHGFVTDDPPGTLRNYPGRPRRVAMYALRVVIEHDPGLSLGFRVYTAYPIWRRRR